MPDGTYTMAISHHHVTPTAQNAQSIAVPGRVLVTELSGSDSSAHFQMGADSWVSLAHGVYRYNVGQEHEFFMDVSQAFYFDPDGRFVA